MCNGAEPIQRYLLMFGVVRERIVPLEGAFLARRARVVALFSLACVLALTEGYGYILSQKGCGVPCYGLAVHEEKKQQEMNELALSSTLMCRFHLSSPTEEIHWISSLPPREE